MAHDESSGAILPGLSGDRADMPQQTSGSRVKRVRGGASGALSWLVIICLFGGLITGTILMFNERWNLVLPFWLVGALAGVGAGIFLLRSEKARRSPNQGLSQAEPREPEPPSNATLVYARVFLWMSVAISALCITGLVFPLDSKLFSVSIFAFVFVMLFVGMVNYCVKSKHWMGALAFLVLLCLVLNALGTAWLDWPFLPANMDPMWLARIIFGAVVLAAAAMLPIYKMNQGLYTRFHVRRAYLAIVLGVICFAVTWLI